MKNFLIVHPNDKSTDMLKDKKNPTKKMNHYSLMTSFINSHVQTIQTEKYICEFSKIDKLTDEKIGSKKFEILRTYIIFQDGKTTQDINVEIINADSEITVKEKKEIFKELQINFKKHLEK